MELTLDKRSFLRGLARTHAVADRRSSMPILSNVLLMTEGNSSLRFAATDLYLGVAATAEAHVLQPGSIAVSSKTLFDIVKNLPDGEVTWSVGPNHSAEIRAGKVRYRIPGLPGEDFPALPSPGDAQFSAIDAEILGSLIAQTQYSISSDDTKPSIAGALFEADGTTLRMVTTDGHRLSKAERETMETVSTPFSMLIPTKGIGELRRLIDDVKSDAKKDEKSMVYIARQGAHAFFKREGILLSVKLAEEQFPQYSKAIPQAQDKRVIISRSMFFDALKRMSLVSSDRNGGVRLSLTPGSLRLVSENPDIGEGNEELDVDYAGAPITIGFNARYILEALNSLSDDEIALDLSRELDPGVLRPAHDETRFVGVVMPMKI